MPPPAADRSCRSPCSLPPEPPPGTLAVGLGDLVRLTVAPDAVTDLVEVLSSRGFVVWLCAEARESGGAAHASNPTTSAAAYGRMTPVTIRRRTYARRNGTTSHARRRSGLRYRSRIVHENFGDIRRGVGRWRHLC